MPDVTRPWQYVPAGTGQPWRRAEKTSSNSGEALPTALAFRRPNLSSRVAFPGWANTVHHAAPDRAHDGVGAAERP